MFDSEIILFGLTPFGNVVRELEFCLTTEALSSQNFCSKTDLFVMWPFQDQGCTVIPFSYKVKGSFFFFMVQLVIFSFIFFQCCNKHKNWIITGVSSNEPTHWLLWKCRFLHRSIFLLQCTIAAKYTHKYKSDLIIIYIYINL